MAVDAAGDIVAIGRERTEAASWDAVVRKYDGHGTLLWSRTYSDP